MIRQQKYKLSVKWTGNNGAGTPNYKGYERSHSILVDNKVEIHGSSDPAFRGDPSKHNPEELLVASLSSCHMLWYLHLCAEAGVIVVDYIDNAVGTMVESSNGGGYFKEVLLNPIVTVTNEEMVGKAIDLHKKANQLCFIANSVNFKVGHQPICKSLLT